MNQNTWMYTQNCMLKSVWKTHTGDQCICIHILQHVWLAVLGMNWSYGQLHNPACWPSWYLTCDHTEYTQETYNEKSFLDLWKNAACVVSREGSCRSILTCNLDHMLVDIWWLSLWYYITRLGGCGWWLFIDRG